MRRQRGEGGYRLRSDGRHEFTVDLGWVNGKRKRKTFYGKTQAEARKKRNDWLRDNPGLDPSLADDRLTVAAWCQLWLSSHHRARPDTIADLQGVVSKHIVPALGHLPLSKLRKSHVDGWVKGLVDSGYAMSTVRRFYGVLHAAVEAAKNDERVHRNVVSLVALPPVHDAERRSLTVEEAQRLIRWAQGQDEPYWTLWQVALHTGLRQSELLGLAWDAVDLESGVLQVRRRVRRRRGVWSLAEVKSKASRRVVPLTPDAVEALEVQRRMNAEHELAWPGDWWRHPDAPELDFIFRRPDGGEPVPTTMACRKRLDDALEACGIPRVVFHELRHTTGSLMLNAGVPVYVVSTLLGHASVQVTERFYAHAQLSSARDAMGALSDLFGS